MLAKQKGGCQGNVIAIIRGGSTIFFRRGCTRLLLYFNTNKPLFFFLQNTSCIRKPQVISGGGGVRTPCTLPPRSAPDYLRYSSVRSGVLTSLYRNPEIPGRIKMEQFIQVEVFWKKSNTFRDITFFPFLPKRPKFSVPFVWITSSRLHVVRKRKFYRYFVNDTTQSRSCFRCQKIIPVPFDGQVFTEISVQKVSAPHLKVNRVKLTFS